MSTGRILAVMALGWFCAGAAGCSWISGSDQPSRLNAEYAFEIHLGQETVGDPLYDAGLSGPQSVDRLIDHAIANHPRILAAQNRFRSAQSSVHSALGLKDPRLSLVAGVEPIQTAAGPQRFSMSFSQEIPRLAKLEARLVRAQAELAIAEAALESERQKVIEAIRYAYAELYKAQLTHDLLTFQKGLLERVATLADSKFQTGQLREQDWRDSQIAIDQMENDRLEALRNIEATRALLAGAVGVSATSNIIALPQLPSVEVTGERDSIGQLVLELNPEIQASLAEMWKQQINAELTALQRLPDPTVSATWSGIDDSGLSPVANGRDTVMLGVSIGLPIFREQLDAQAMSASALAAARVDDHRSLKLKHHATAISVFDSIYTRIDQLQRLETRILPAAEEVFNSALEDFQVDRLEYESVTDYWQRQYTLRREVVDLRAALYKDYATLLRLLGGAIPVPEEEESPMNSPVDDSTIFRTDLNQSFSSRANAPSLPPAAPPGSAPSGNQTGTIFR